MDAAIGRASAGRFDHYMCTESQDTRRRTKGDIVSRSRADLPEAGISEEQIVVIPIENDAVVHAFKLERPGDLLIISVRQSALAWPRITSFKPG